MKKEELQDLQPTIFGRFQQILKQKKLAHAYLFSGDFASFEMAIFLSQSIFCLEKDGEEACGECRNCRLIAQEEFSDVTILRPSGNLIKTDSIRELVKNFSQSGFESKEQVYIICDAEKMHVNAANSLLKEMEEPQSEIRLFLLTNHEEAILPTIKSRTQLMTFPKNKEKLIYLLEKEGVLKTQARIVADMAGTQEEALQLAKSKSFQDSLSLATKFVNQLLDRSQMAYLMVGQLVSLTNDKKEQEGLLDLLTLLLAEKKEDSRARELLQGLLDARAMLKSNVSLQNALEYMILR